MLADRAIEATDINETINTDYTSTFGSSTQIDSNTPPRKFLSKISKSFKNLSWFKTETDLNGTMVASKLGTEMISDKPSQQIFSPLHTCPLGQSSNAEDLPELTPPEINITKPIATKSTVRPSGTFNKKTGNGIVMPQHFSLLYTIHSDSRKRDSHYLQSTIVF